MATLNGDQAVSAALARITNQPGGCLATVWQFYGSHPSIGPHAGQYPDAINGWAYATKRHPGDLHPPAGYPVYFDALPHPRYAGDDNYPSGDVVISIGGGLVRCTDGAGAGRMATMTIAKRAAQIGRTYLGWTEDFLGYDVVTTAVAASTASPATPIPNGDEDMAAKYQIVKAAPPSQSIYFVHPGGIAPVHSVDPEVKVLESFAAQMNAGNPPVLTDGQYKLVDEVMQRRL